MNKIVTLLHSPILNLRLWNESEVKNYDSFCPDQIVVLQDTNVQ